jgi:hypothetical protein
LGRRLSYLEVLGRRNPLLPHANQTDSNKPRGNETHAFGEKEVLRVYKWVESCPDYNGSHEHLIDGETEYCHASGKWIKDSNPISYKELKEKWKSKK